MKYSFKSNKFASAMENDYNMHWELLLLKLNLTH